MAVSQSIFALLIVTVYHDESVFLIDRLSHAVTPSDRVNTIFQMEASTA